PVRARSPAARRGRLSVATRNIGVREEPVAVAELREQETHVILDRESRLLKACKIERLLERHVRLEGARVLDVGTGSGYIAASLAGRVGPAGSVVAVDVVDKRQVSDGFEFTQVAGTTLPFPDQSFD